MSRKCQLNTINNNCFHYIKWPDRVARKVHINSQVTDSFNVISSRQSHIFLHPAIFGLYSILNHADAIKYKQPASKKSKALICFSWWLQYYAIIFHYNFFSPIKSCPYRKIPFHFPLTKNSILRNDLTCVGVQVWNTIGLHVVRDILFRRCFLCQEEYVVPRCKFSNPSELGHQLSTRSVGS